MSVSSALQKPARAIGLAAFFAWELLVANVRVALDVLSPRTTIQPAVVAIPLDITSDAEILLLSALINITPGSVTIDLSEDRRTLFVHVMHMTSPEASRLDIKGRSSMTKSELVEALQKANDRESARALRASS